jgi:uncharacterized protein DUF5372
MERRWERSCTQTHRDTPQVNEIPDHITITDPQHPLYGQTFSILRTRSSRRNSRVVLILPNGHTRTVSRSVTDIDRPPVESSTVLPISAATLLPLARYIRDKVLAREEQSYDASSPVNISNPSDHSDSTTTIDECFSGDNLGGVRREPTDPTNQIVGRTDSPASRPTDD